MVDDAVPESADVRRIGVVEDHQVTITGLRQVLADEPSVEIVATAPSVPELLAITTDLALVVLDLRLPDGSTPAENIERLRAAGIETLVFTSADEPYLVRAAARAGVLGVVRKSERDEVVAAAVREAAAGKQVPTTDWAIAIDGDDDFTGVKLSPRQREVLALYASGEPAARVARLTDLTEETVNAYLGRIRLKYAEAGRPARTKTELFKRALEDGWLPIPRRRRAP
ncbi:response regulator [Nocardia fluminea]|uniref:response regulator n=1 Tax=Nocardia fluminea TaxID=134984 RepID=UPI003650C497